MVNLPSLNQRQNEVSEYILGRPPRSLLNEQEDIILADSADEEEAESQVDLDRAHRIFEANYYSNLVQRRAQEPPILPAQVDTY